MFIYLLTYTIFVEPTISGFNLIIDNIIMLRSRKRRINCE